MTQIMTFLKLRRQKSYSIYLLIKTISVKSGKICLNIGAKVAKLHPSAMRTLKLLDSKEFNGDKQARSRPYFSR
jgi:hypothetical protein